MNRKELTKEMLNGISLVTAAHDRYLAQTREYLPGQMLYMREAHFAIAVGDNPNSTMSELSQLLKVTPGAVSQLALRLEKKGFIVRDSSPSDRRSNRVHLTPLGEELYKAHSEYDKQMIIKISKLLSDYTDEQLLLLIDLQNKIANTFDNENVLN